MVSNGEQNVVRQVKHVDHFLTGLFCKEADEGEKGFEGALIATKCI